MRDLLKIWLAQMRQSTIDSRSRFPNDAGDAVFLSPHCDDICFSLGALTHRLQAGILLNVFSKSGHVARVDLAPQQLAALFESGSPDSQTLGLSPRPEAAEAWVNWVTKLRSGEDEAFAEACGLRRVELNLPEAPLRAQHPFKGQSSAKDALDVETALMGALSDLAAATKGTRPWLFCPAGIGGHIDHLLVRDAILKRLGELQRLYRIAFYEDLHYASGRLKRWRGLAEFHAAARMLDLSRIKLPMLDGGDEKLRLVHLYASQLTPDLMDIACYSPPASRRTGLHEAVWSASASGVV
ncbi:MAG TPA: hypothetical protein VIJ06_00435 [Methylovirgula sp.]